MGEVWKARDVRVDRFVAIKFSQAQFTERFRTGSPRHWAGLAPGETVERDLSAVERASRPLLSGDGGTLVLTDGSKPEGMVYLQPANGSPSGRLHEGRAWSISPDGKSLQVYRTKPAPANFLVPTGVGEEKEFVAGDLGPRAALIGWLPEDQGYVVYGGEPPKGPGLHIWRPAAHSLKSISPAVRNGHMFCDARSERCLARVIDGHWMLFPTDGSSPVEVKGIGDRDTPLNFTWDGKAILLAGPRVNSMIQVMKIDLLSGARTLWKPPSGRSLDMEVSSAIKTELPFGDQLGASTPSCLAYEAGAEALPRWEEI